MSSRFPNNTSGGASPGVTPSPRSGSKFRGYKMGVVWTAPCGVPVATFADEMVHNAVHFYGARLIDLEFPAIGNNKKIHKKTHNFLTRYLLIVI